MKVLFVQEEPFLAAALKLTMRSKGFDFVVSEDTTNAFSVISEVNPQIVVADINQGEGLSYVAEAKKNNMSVIVIGANGKEKELEEAFDHGADDYISLPLSFTELALRVSLLARLRVA